MDEASRSAMQFLEAVEAGRDALGRLANGWNGAHKHKGVWAKAGLSVAGRQSQACADGRRDKRDFAGSIALGIVVRVRGGRELEYLVEILWDAERWYVQTEVWEEEERGGNALVRELPERRAEALADCLEHIKQAVEDLAGCEDILRDRVAAQAQDAPQIETKEP